MKLRSLLAGALVAFLAVPVVAQAQQGTPTRVRGTIETFKGKTLVVKSREGADVTIALADNFTVRAMGRVRLSSIKKGDFVGIAATTGTDGKTHAQEVLVFPEAMRGTGEGQHPWDLTPGSTMTDATVGEISKASKDRILHLQYKDGTTDIDVAPGTPTVTFKPGTPRLLKPGRAVVVFASKGADGTFTSATVAVQKGKVTPPM